PLAVDLAGPYGQQMAVMIMQTTFLVLLIVPFFLIHNGIVMIRREGLHPAHMLSLFLGILVFAGEAAMAAVLIAFALSPDYKSYWQRYHSLPSMAGVMFSVSVIYFSMSFVIFMIYTVFLQIIPRRKDFDYVIIHGAGLLRGDQLSRLLKDRLDKAVSVYKKDPTPPKLIPSGGKGDDETISEAEAMKRYLMEQGIPEEDILPEDRSKTTYENLAYSKAILDRREGDKYTALVTSNYHVYRALRYCRKVGLTCTGIGSRVAFYYWPSALIREYIAIHAEPKHALITLALWLPLMGLIFLLMRG
ncbi:MAG: YdcF family protein, partial [Lachnospiraceae bacterium]|nr:YdcF family protein [Lachnospiraceae bacterium]